MSQDVAAVVQIQSTFSWAEWYIDEHLSFTLAKDYWNDRKNCISYTEKFAAVMNEVIDVLSKLRELYSPRSSFLNELRKFKTFIITSHEEIEGDLLGQLFTESPDYFNDFELQSFISTVKDQWYLFTEVIKDFEAATLKVKLENYIFPTGLIYSLHENFTDVVWEPIDYHSFLSCFDLNRPLQQRLRVKKGQLGRFIYILSKSSKIFGIEVNDQIALEQFKISNYRKEKSKAKQSRHHNFHRKVDSLFKAYLPKVKF